MKRYDCELFSHGWDNYSAEMVESNLHGEWVRAADALDLMARVLELEAFIKRLGNCAQRELCAKCAEELDEITDSIYLK